MFQMKEEDGNYLVSYSEINQDLRETSNTDNMSDNGFYLKCKWTCKTLKDKEFLKDDAIECQLNRDIDCLTKYFLICLRSEDGNCDWQVIGGNCHVAKEDQCRKLIDKVRLYSEKYPKICLEYDKEDKEDQEDKKEEKRVRRSSYQRRKNDRREYFGYFRFF